MRFGYGLAAFPGCRVRRLQGSRRQAGTPRRKLLELPGVERVVGQRGSSDRRKEGLDS